MVFIAITYYGTGSPVLLTLTGWDVSTSTVYVFNFAAISLAAASFGFIWLHPKKGLYHILALILIVFAVAFLILQI